MKRTFLFLGTLISAASYAQNLSLAEAALERTYHKVRYDPAYVSIPYPNGDVPADTGVCTDVVIRSFRKLGIDLQREVHEDISSHFQAYPSKRIWGLSQPDKNIDHRRVPNLQTFFTRKGLSLPITAKAEDYLPGDIVTWILPGNLPHIGIVTAKPSSHPNRYLIAHNIGAGPVLEDMLFSFQITGHYRYSADQVLKRAEQ
ncbi:DUF1287 domain-containing protein [Microbulbifer sp. SSSA002]|uniref:DUF1287 domain-containing protein n=1 Tax=unclassified Microbulbifer TaxID=2619833 RepID=UPI00403A2A85